MITTIYNSLPTSYTYNEYLELIEKLYSENKTTNNDNSESMLQYTQLNISRMNRLDKKIEIDQATNEQISYIKTPMYWIVITEGWCGDAAQIIPIINKMASLNSNIELKLVLRDQNEPLMNLFLTYGSKSIPKLIAIDKNSESVLFDWGPRPKGAQQLLDDYKAKHGQLDTAIKTELQKWYTKDKGATVMNEICKLLSLLN